MTRRRTFLIIFIVLIVILAIGLGALFWMRGGFGGKVVQEPPPEVGEAQPTPEERTKRVVVALQTIPRGMQIPPDAIAIREWPEEDLPEDPIDSLEEVVGMYARAEILRERPISASNIKFVSIGEGSDFSLAIRPGRVGVAVPVTVLSAVGNALRPGDRVDVLISFSIVAVDEDSQIKLPLVLVGGEDCLAGCQPTGEQIPRVVSQYTVQDALVLGVGLWEEEVPEGEAAAAEEEAAAAAAEGEEGPPPETTTVGLTDVKVIILEVDPQEALVLKWLRETNASMDLVMRSAMDEGVHSTEAVTLQYMIDRYQISLPPKLPHTPENEFKYSLPGAESSSPPEQ
jgi:Flp pilus assembly protein CpaB